MGPASVRGSGDDRRGRRQAVVDALRRHAIDHLAGYKRPKRYEVVEDLPRTATGKVRRLALPEALGLA